MTGEEFTGFCDHMGWNNIKAGEQLGASRNSISRYKAEGTPLTIDLACAALAQGLAPWPKGKGVEQRADDQISLTELEAVRDAIDRLIAKAR